MIVYLISYAGSFFLAGRQHYYLSGILLMLAALWLYIRDYRHSKNLIHLRGVFSLFWVGGQGLACLKLSHLQGEWQLMSWICMALAFMGFWVVFELLSRTYGTGYDSHSRWRSFKGDPKPVYHMVCGVTVVSLAAFLTEAIVLGYVPLFLRGVPHAYSEFHLTGIHYITVSCVLVPSLAVLHAHMERGRGSEKRLFTSAMMTGTALLIPVFCVSRFQFVFAVLLAGFTYISLQKQFSPVYLLSLAAVVPVYLILSVARSHDVEYLNGIFEMKYEKMPIFITQPYMYVANNYENFNCMAEQLTQHSFGIRMLFPVFALTGLKFVFPQLTSSVVYLTKPELTTLTMFYDAYYDFGVPGVFLFAVLVGGAAGRMMIVIKESTNPAAYLFYGQMAIYLGLAFFTTWFSNPTTWFWLVLTGMMYWYVGYDKDKGHREKEEGSGI